MVFTLNVATVVTFATLPCALQLLLQRSNASTDRGNDLAHVSQSQGS
jgi:hypothetical protein